MHRRLLIATLLLVAPCAAAQVNYYGTLGIYDDPAHTQPFGSMTPGLKTLYIGVDIDPSSELGIGLTGLEFSVSGLDAVFLLGIDVQPTPVVVFGDIHAPADTAIGTGGINIAWSECILDSGVSIALNIGSPAPPTDHVLQVLPRFPPNFSWFPHAFAVPCVGPCLCFMALEGRSYTLNPAVATEHHTWGAVKNLFRGP